MMKAVVVAALAATAAPVAAQEAPPVPELEYAFGEYVTLGEAITVGKTPYGNRRIIPITGGTFEGPGIKGTIHPGSWDWQLDRADGCIDVEADYMIETDDGVIINVLNLGAICMPTDGQPPQPVRTQPRFEAPVGKYDWLNRSAFIGTLELPPNPTEPAVVIRFYRAK